MNSLKESKVKLTSLELELLSKIKIAIDQEEQEENCESYFCLNPLQIDKTNNIKYRGALANLIKKEIVSAYGEDDSSNDYLAVYYELDF